jgi:ABC-type multidrug transport system fused ATPase/permease subunit
VRHSRLIAHLLSALVPIMYQNIAGLIIVGGLAGLYFGGVEDLASWGVVTLLLLRALNYSQTFQAVFHQVVERIPYLDQLEELERTYCRSASTGGSRTLARIDRLGFEQVSFAYHPPDMKLRQVSFTVERGETIGIVGPSGSGKSTLIQLLLRLRQPTLGQILVNDVPASEFSLESWFRLVSYVPQEPQLLSESIAENIAFYRPEVTRDRVEQAARMAGIHEDVSALPAVYESTAGERGGSFSGGQRQRICIARALAGQPDVIIFDEPTSALDVHSESLIQEALGQLKGRTTLFIIAHRLSTLNICDRVMVLKAGRLQAFAPARELMESDPYFAEACKLSRFEVGAASGEQAP